MWLKGQLDTVVRFFKCHVQPFDRLESVNFGIFLKTGGNRAVRERKIGTEQP